MNGELAQLVALVAHTKLALSPSEAAERLTLENSTFRFVHALQFEETRRLFGIARTARVASSPDEWCDHLRRIGVDSVELSIWSRHGRFADHVLSALSGGGHWGISTTRAASTSLWIARWTPDHPRDPQRRIWSVSYRESLAAAVTPIRSNPGDAADRLRQALRRAGDLAGDLELAVWADCFAEAELRLTAEPVRYEFHPDMLPRAGYGIASRRLLAACEKAWVFGGMGSWNDLGFQEPAVAARYHSVTTELYGAVTSGIASAVNSLGEGAR
jgi:hypothetical protein